MQTIGILRLDTGSFIKNISTTYVDFRKHANLQAMYEAMMECYRAFW